MFGLDPAAQLGVDDPVVAFELNTALATRLLLIERDDAQREAAPGQYAQLWKEMPSVG